MHARMIGLVHFIGIRTRPRQGCPTSPSSRKPFPRSSSPRNLAAANQINLTVWRAKIACVLNSAPPQNAPNNSINCNPQPALQLLAAVPNATKIPPAEPGEGEDEDEVFVIAPMTTDGEQSPVLHKTRYEADTPPRMQKNGSTRAYRVDARGRKGARTLDEPNSHGDLCELSKIRTPDIQAAQQRRRGMQLPGDQVPHPAFRLQLALHHQPSWPRLQILAGCWPCKFGWSCSCTVTVSLTLFLACHRHGHPSDVSHRLISTTAQNPCFS